MIVELILADGSRKTYENVTSMHTTMSLNRKTDEFEYTFCIYNDDNIEQTCIKEEHIIGFEIYQADNIWINRDGKIICPRCHHHFNNFAYMRELKYCPNCGNRVYSINKED